LDMAYHSSVGCDRRGDQPTGYATPSACFHTPEITITRYNDARAQWAALYGVIKITQLADWHPNDKGEA
ncbi:hypothetical protein ACRCO4_21050, partial [Pseudomonas aeruginosa]